MSHSCNLSKAYPELELNSGEYDTTLFMDRGKLATELAARYEGLKSWHSVSAKIRAAAIAKTLELYTSIPVPVVQIPGCEPFHSAEDMEVYIRQNGFFPVRYHAGSHAVFGKYFTEFRAVHDWFGHMLGLNPFTFPGEVRAYDVHSREYPEQVLPVIWSNVVLENAFRVNRGHWLVYGYAGGQSKLVCDPVQFPGMCVS